MYKKILIYPYIHKKFTLLLRQAELINYFVHNFLVTKFKKIIILFKIFIFLFKSTNLVNNDLIFCYRLLIELLS